jgi:hypothetical protein
MADGKLEHFPVRRMTFADQPPRTFTYRIAGDTLYLKLSDGEESAYLRAGERNGYGSQSP